MMSVIWTVAIIAFAVTEAMTTTLVSIWFVFGALVALIASFLHATVMVQVVLFVGVSAVALAVTRPLLKKYNGRKAIPTNADRVLGEIARVTETIDNENSSGAVFIDGKTWTARSKNDEVIPTESMVKVLSMEGVKLIVQIETKNNKEERKWEDF